MNKKGKRKQRSKKNFKHTRNRKKRDEKKNVRRADI